MRTVLLTLLATGAAVFALALTGCGCSKSHEQGAQTGQWSENALTTLIDAMDQEPPDDEVVDRFLALASASESSSDLRIFQHAETAFGSKSDTERAALRQAYIERSRRLRVLARAGLDRAMTLHEDGSRSEARAIIRDVERIGRANSGPPEWIVLIGAMTGEAILRAAHEAHQTLTAAGEPQE